MSLQVAKKEGSIAGRQLVSSTSNVVARKTDWLHYDYPKQHVGLEIRFFNGIQLKTAYHWSKHGPIDHDRRRDIAATTATRFRWSCQPKICDRCSGQDREKFFHRHDPP